MARGILLVFSNPSAPDRLDEFNAWYTDVHLPEFLRVPGVKAARRFELSATQMSLPPGTPLGGRRFLAAYEVEVEDFAALRERSDVLEREPLALTLLFEQIGETQEEEPEP